MKTCFPKVLVDDRWIGNHGIGRFAREVISRLPAYTSLPLTSPHLGVLNPWQVARVINRLKPDVYFSPGFNPPSGSQAPFIFCLHDLIHLDLESERSAKKTLYYNFVVKPAARKASRILTVSEFSRQRITEWAEIPEEQVLVVGCGVDPDFKPDGEKHSHPEPYLIFVGHDKPHKNLLRTLQAFKQAQSSATHDLIVVAAKEAAILTWLKDLDLTERVHLTGPVSDQELQALYRGAVCCLFPTLYEGFGLPALEAMASGLPVLTSDRTSLPEVVGAAALIVDPESTGAISNGLDQLCTNLKLRKRLSEQGLHRARSFTWAKTAELVAEALCRAVR